MAKIKAQAKGLVRRALTWPWRKLPWHGKLIMLPALAVGVLYLAFWLANFLFGVAY